MRIFTEQALEQYQRAVQRVEELLPLVDDNTPLSDPNSIELEKLSNMVADYSDVHFAIGSPTLSDIIRLRMEEMGISISKLAKLLGVPTNKRQELPIWGSRANTECRKRN